MASRGLAVSKKQCCDILGWTSSQFDKAVREGMPVAEHPSGRGTDYVVFMGDVVRWIVKQELLAAGHEPDENAPLDLNAERAWPGSRPTRRPWRTRSPAASCCRPNADEVVYTALRDRVMAVRSEAPRIRDAAVKDGVAAVREILDRALSDALMDVGAKSLAGLQDPTGFAA